MKPDAMDCSVMRYEDIRVGDESSFKAVLSAAMIRQYAQITGDRHPLHTDQEYAKSRGFKGIIAHGMLTSAFASRLVGMHIPGERSLVLSQEFRYPKPVYPGAELVIRGVVREKLDAFSAVVISVEITDQSGDCVARGSVTVKVRD